MKLEIRRANASDKEFIIDAIMAAEKGGANVVSYCYIFSLTEDDFRRILSDILDEDIAGQELSISAYLIAEIDGVRAATMGGWLEMEHGMSSKIIKSNVLMHFIDREIIMNAAPLIQIMNEIDIPREPNAFQLEISYTADPYRGIGLYGKLVNEHVRLKKLENDFNKIQGVIMSNNTSPYRALTKLGFTKAMEKTSTNKEILNIFAADTKILMEKTL